MQGIILPCPLPIWFDEPLSWALAVNQERNQPQGKDFSIRFPQCRDQPTDCGLDVLTEADGLCLWLWPGLLKVLAQSLPMPTTTQTWHPNYTSPSYCGYWVARGPEQPLHPGFRQCHPVTSVNRGTARCQAHARICVIMSTAQSCRETK